MGRRVGQFVLEAFLEGSGEGAVFRARRLDGGGDRSATVKLLRTPTPGPEVLRSFQEEHRILASLRHAAIPRVLGSGITQDGCSWFATDFVLGRPLLRHAREQGLGLAQRIGFMIEMCRAVEHAHQRKVLHPDLGPESLMVTTSGQPRILGFGVPGTDTSRNVAALGWTLYELLSEVRPYLTVLRGDGPPRTGLLPRRRPRPRMGIDHVCLKAIRAGRREGYRSAGDLADDLQGVLERRPVSLMTSGPGSWFRRRVADILRRAPASRYDPAM